MSIPATMKFIVRGKSVDFKIVRVQVPLSPKAYIDIPTISPISILVSGSKFLIFLIHSIVLQTDLTGNAFHLTQVL